ncbi:putative HEPN domain-containing protein [uncultured Gammaproteobacteria bacterium]
MNTSKDFLKDAVSLRQDAMSEARRRTILSRLYYAAYHRMNETEIGQQFHRDPKRGVGMHRQFLDHLQHSSDKTFKRTYRHLFDMYKLRILADYKLNKNISVDDVRHQYEDADALFHDILGDTP